MKKKKVYIDFDDTIVMTVERMVAMLNIRFNTNKNWRNMKLFSAKDLFPEATSEHINELFSSKTFFNKKLRKMQGMERVLTNLEDYFDYEIVTLGTPDNLKHKEQWCNENLPFNFKFTGLTDFTIKKTCVDLSDGVMIDDNTEVLAGTNAKHKILLTNNMEFDWNYIHPIHHKGIIPYGNWNEIGEFLERYLLEE